MGLILTDLDETVLDFTTPFTEWVQSKGWTVHGEMRDVYDLTKLLQTDHDTAMGLIHEFHTEVPAFRALEPESCAAKILPDLYRDGYRFVAITACVDTPEVRQARLDNLREAFGFEWIDCVCVGLRNDKKASLAFHPRSIWVEDNAKHAADGAALGHDTFLITRGYNAALDVPGVRRVADWHEIASHL